MRQLQLWPLTLGAASRSESMTPSFLPAFQSKHAAAAIEAVHCSTRAKSEIITHAGNCNSKLNGDIALQGWFLGSA